MWSFNRSHKKLACAAVCSLAVLQGCTVEPLNSSSANSALSAGSVDSTTASVLAGIQVAEVNTRVAQQTRNALLFALNGGNQVQAGDLKLTLNVSSESGSLSILTSVQAATSAQVEVKASYSMVDSKTGKVVASGVEKSIAPYDLTPQSFANQRALRDAENRAAKTLAQKIRLALAQKISGS